MSESLADLFSASSPPPEHRPRTPSPPPQTDLPLFFSPGETPDRPRHVNEASEAGSSRIPSVQDPDVRVEGSNAAIDDFDWGPVPGVSETDIQLVDPLAVDALPLKKKRVIAKVDEERLMGPNGFPALMKAAKRFKVRGKGREAEDLRELLSVYQMWAHGMFPKGDFHGTIARVEVVCRKRRMEMAMKGYREAFYPALLESPGSSPGPTDNDPEQHSSPAVRAMGGVSQADEDGPDMDELLAMEEMEREQIEPLGPPEDDDWD
ncbi:replication fork protection component Swi3-domain-containing protein [Kockovaella imperatae]|uniref:Chromosome segregation in meiosis protein n=1 Tax=Kockovaella imperatae TaxID=4999 RepID=A0A1Y1UMY7_9TREE|nr:replication fork protection component Swi3-domain-containing protein [Kockovaella imperatae]ORX38877.1 replication fork protection component Swi3-domain-containing protein [Kockovaella imperatae]